MNVIVDSSIIFSALLLKHSRIRHILSGRAHTFYCPNYVFVEIFKYKEKILRHSKLDEIELYEYFNRLMSNLRFVNVGVISRENRTKAVELCKDVDEKDSPFVALAVEFDALIWTGDKKLRKGLEAKGFTQFTDMDALEGDRASGGQEPF